jgi:alpha-L-rhamnosidase
MPTDPNPAPPIWIAGEPAPNTWACFRHDFELPAVPARALARVSVDSKYWLWVNGALVVREGGLKRGPTPEAGYVDEIDLTSHLRPGRNTLAVLAWYFGLDGASHRGSGRAYVKLRLALDAGRTIETGADWRARRHPAFRESDQRPTLNGKVLLSEHAIDFDAALDLPGWTAPDYDDRAWSAAIELPPAKKDQGDQLRPFAPWLDSEIEPYENDTELRLPRTGPRELTGTLPANYQVYPWLRVRAQGGEPIVIQVERHKFSSTYRCRAGVNEFEVPAWGNGHWVRYEIPAGVTVEALGYRRTMYPAPAIGEFTSSEPWMNTLWRKAVLTQQVCMRDTFMDCPDRERSPWPGDFANMAEFCGYALGAPGLDLVRKSMAEFVAWRAEEGILWGPTPTGRFHGTFREFPAQSLATLGIGLRDFWWHSGDLEFLREIYPAVRHYLLDVYSMDADGHVPHRGPWETAWDAGTQSWYDWGGEIDRALLDQTWYACALQALVQFAEACGDAATTAECRERLTRGAEFLQTWWDAAQGAYRAPDFEAAPDPRGNALAVLAGLAPATPAVTAGLTRCLTERLPNGIYMEKHVIDALFHLGRPDLALARVQSRYAPDLASPYSTLPEDFGTDANHAWGVGPAAALIREVIGLRPAEPGWRHFHLRPADVPIEHTSATIPTPVGPLSITLHRPLTHGDAAAPWTLEINSPTALKGTLELPARFTRIEANPAPSNPERTETAWRLTLTGGRYQITALP